MQSLRNGMFAAAAIMAFGSGLAVVEIVSTRSALAQPGFQDDRWQFHDGHWGHWNQADKRWYYTNGDHWFYNDGNAWRLYRFDKEFGRKGFERGAYKEPGPGVEVVVPGHKVYVRP